MSFIITLIALGFIIFIHELGHLLAAKKAKVGVTEFAVGMGPKVASFHFKGTMYSLRALPFGGFIKAKGMEDLEPCPVEEDYREKSILSRASILIAGSFMNVLFGYLMFVFIFFFVGQYQLLPVIQGVSDGSPAQEQGLSVGDEILRINNQSVVNVQEDIIDVIQASNGESITLDILTGGEQIQVTLSPKKNDTGVPLIGVSFQSTPQPVGVGSALQLGLKKTAQVIGQSFKGLGLIATGKANVKELAGPVGIVQMASSQVNRSFVSFLSILAFISISLGIINLLPLPVLDGGHLLFLLIEAFRGKPLSSRLQTAIHNVAAACLIALMVFIVFNDIISWNDRSLIMETKQ